MADKPDFLKERLLSLDAYRGLIMIALAFSGFGLETTAKRHLEAEGPSVFWEEVKHQWSHVEWVGCGFWDLIQPSFMFMVGVAAAYSYAKRRESGGSESRLFLHIVFRSLILVVLGIFLISNGKKFTEWSFMNVLTQIGLGYPFLYLLWGRSFRVQTVAAAGILVGTYLLYVTYQGAGLDVSEGAAEVGVPSRWAEENLDGVGPAWHKNANVGHAIDLWLLNLLPQNKPFEFNAGGYQTINFIPSLATMLFGLMCGELLRSQRSSSSKLGILFLAGIAGLVVGFALDRAGICPLVKRIWTPSWAVFSTGWCVLILACLYGFIDVLGWKAWAFPLVVVGVNSIAIYCMGMLMRGWTRGMLMTHLGDDLYVRRFGTLWEPTLQACLVGIVFWLICLWMHRQKIYIRI